MMLYKHDDIGQKVWIPPTISFMLAGFLFAIGAYLGGVSVISIAPCLGGVGAIVGGAWSALLMSELSLRRFEIVYRLENGYDAPEASQNEYDYDTMVIVGENEGQYVGTEMFVDSDSKDQISVEGIQYLGECLSFDKKFKTSHYSDSKITRPQFEFIRNLFVRKGWADRDYVLSYGGRAISRWMARIPLPH